MRYQTIDTMTGEILRETARHPLFAPLAKRPRLSPRKHRTRRTRQEAQLIEAAGLLVLLAALVVALSVF